MIEFKLIAKEEMKVIIPFWQLLNKNIPTKVLEHRLDAMIEENYQCIGIYKEDELIGVCGIWILTKYYVGRHIEPDNLIILKPYQGQGIGERLMEWIETFAQKNDCVAGELNCYISNKSAQKFWEAQGYEAIGYHYQKKF